MSTHDEGFIAVLKQVKAGFEALNLSEKETIISLGAALEQLLAEIPDSTPRLGDFMGECLEGLQSLYLGTCEQPDVLARTLTEATGVIEQAFSLDDENKVNIAIEMAMEMIRIVAAQNTEPAGETLASLDDIASSLVLSGPTDIEELTGIKRSLDILAHEDYPAEVKSNIVQASQAAQEILENSAADPKTAFGEIVRLVESAIHAIDEAEWLADTEESSDAEAEPDNIEIEEEVTVPELVVQTSEADALPADADKDLLGEFITECREYIEGAEVALLALETNPSDTESVNTVFRAFHTIKGTSAFLGLDRISELAHKAENLLSRVRDGEIQCTGGYADLALQSVDMLKELLQGVQNALGGQPMVRPGKYDGLIKVLTDPEASGYASERAQTAEGTDTTVLQASVEPTKAESASVGAETSTKQAPARAEAAPVADCNPIRPQKRTITTETTVDSSVRVRTDRLDKLIDTVGELVIAQSMVTQDETVLMGSHHDLSKKVLHMSKIVRELQYLSMSMRMVPLKPTFQKMARLVRDVAYKSGKQVEFISEGEDTEIDRNMVDVVNEPLVHMIRNAVDHGVENPDVRRSAGKNPKGVVKLSARHAGGNVIVEMRDDGRGLDREKIVQKAIAKGLIESDRGMTDGEVYNLIFEPGFSTADKVTDISGRGVGLDVVKKSVETLRGRIEISSEPGKGSTFSMRLPLTMAVTDGMLVRVGDERFIIPTINIHKSFRPSIDTLSTITGRGEMVMLRGELMAIFRLHQVFQIEGAIEDPTHGLLVILDDGDRKCALLVDELLGQQHVVAKPLSDGIGKLPGVSGGAILGDGRVGLILDPCEIASLARQYSEGAPRREVLTAVAA